VEERGRGGREDVNIEVKGVGGGEGEE